jgi:hypothetical protein
MQLRRVPGMQLSGHGRELKGHYKSEGDERLPGYCLRTAGFKL